MHVQRVISGGSLCGNVVARAIRRGELQPPSVFQCADCGKHATEYDHRDYNEPLKVEPVCRGCNARRGKAIPRRWNNGELFAQMKNAANRWWVSPCAPEWCIARFERVCSHIERRTNGTITRHDLRPDIFGKSERAA